jgi:hypothetical protein
MTGDAGPLPAASGAGGAALEIVWVRSAKVGALRHGMVGQVRAFTLDTRSLPMELQCKLPGPLGAQPLQHVPDEESAHLLAGEMLAEFLGRLWSGGSSAG